MPRTSRTQSSAGFSVWGYSSTPGLFSVCHTHPLICGSGTPELSSRPGINFGEPPVVISLANRPVWSCETAPVCMCMARVCAHGHFLSQTHALWKHPCDGLCTFASDAAAALRCPRFLCRPLPVVFPGGSAVVLGSNVLHYTAQRRFTFLEHRFCLLSA